MMNSPEFMTCDLQEYTDGKAGRVKEDHLSVDGLYTVMFALEPYRSRGKAVKYSGEVVDIDMHNNGLFYMVRFNLLDSSGKPARRRNDAFYDGYLLAKGDHNEFANVGYFREEGASPADQLSYAEAADAEEIVSVVSDRELAAA